MGGGLQMEGKILGEVSFGTFLKGRKNFPCLKDKPLLTYGGEGGGQNGPITHPARISPIILHCHTSEDGIQKSSTPVWCKPLLTYGGGGGQKRPKTPPTHSFPEP